MNNISIQQGWECPKCGRIYSPTTPECYHCNKEISNEKHDTEWVETKSITTTIPKDIIGNHIPIIY